MPEIILLDWVHTVVVSPPSPARLQDYMWVNIEAFTV